MEAIESLKKEMQSTTGDSARFFVIDQLANQFSKIDFDSAEFYNALNIEFANEESSDFYFGHALYRKGMNHVFSNQLKEAVSILNEALLPITQSGNKLLEARTHYALGNLNYTMSVHSKAIFHYQKSVVLSDSLNYPKGRIDSRHNLGGVFFDLEDYDRSKEYLREAKELVEELGDYKRIPMVLAVMTELDLLQKDYERVDSVAWIIIKMADTLEMAQYHVPPSYMKLGEVRVKYEEYDQALVYFFEALKQLNDPDLFYPGPRDMKRGTAYYLIGSAYYELEEYATAKEYLMKADSIARNLDLYKVLRDASELLWKIEEEEKNFQMAMIYHQQFKSYSDSILNNNTLKKILKVRVNHEIEQMEKEEAHKLAMVELNARQKARTYNWIIALSILSLVIVGLLLALQRSKTKREILHREKVQSNLEVKDRELAAYVLQLLRKNELIIEISENLKKAKKAGKKDQQKELQSILQSISINSKDIGWDEFELRFKEVHPTFYERLAQHQPNLTTNENRLCAFLKLNMTSKEISAFTFQTEHSIVQARSRLKKKLGLSDTQKLSQFIATV